MGIGGNIIKLAATTSADVSEVINVPDGKVVSVACVPNLAGAEVAVIQTSMDNNSSFEDYYDSGAIVQLTATHTVVRLHGPCNYKVSKGITAGSTAVRLQV